MKRILKTFSFLIVLNKMPAPKNNNVDSSTFLNEFYCKIKLNDIEFLPQNIEVLNIKESIFYTVPTMDMIFYDNGLFTEENPIKDGDTITVEIAKNKQKDSPIVMQFEILNFVIHNTDGDNVQVVAIQLTGIMKVRNLMFPATTKSYPNKPSIDVFKDIANDCGLKCETRLKTSDAMNWLQVNMNNYEMLNYVWQRSFKPNDVLLYAITRDSEMIVTSLDSEAKNKSTMICSFDAVRAITDKNENAGNKKEELYFNNFTFVDVSNQFNRTMGYGTTFSVYDLDEVKKYEIKRNDIKTSEFNNISKKNIGKTVKNDTMYVHNEKNMHQNFHLAQFQNEYIFKDFFKRGIVLPINANKNVNLFDKIDLIFPEIGKLNAVNEVQSGQYIVGNITHQISKKGYYRMSITVYRSGMNASGYSKNFGIVS